MDADYRAEVFGEQVKRVGSLYGGWTIYKRKAGNFMGVKCRTVLYADSINELEQKMKDTV